MTITVPWNAMWSGEMRYELRPCRWAGGKLAIWSPNLPGEGRPLFKRPHMVRQRQSVMRMLCTVCGCRTPHDDRWWFQLGRFQEKYFMTTEAPVHRACADLALQLCPHLKDRADVLEPFPRNFTVLSAVVGGAATENDFNVKFQPGQTAIGHLKIAWPRHLIRIKGEDVR